MIIYLIFALIVATILSWTLLKQRFWRYSLGIITGMALVASIGVFTLNSTDHYGMKKVTTTTTHQIYSVTGTKSAAGIMVAKELGTKSNRYILVYADKENGSAQTHFVPNQKKIVNTVKKRATYKITGATTAKVVTKTTRWEWKNDTYKTWLNVGEQGGELVSQRSVAYVPKKTWLVLSPTQLKKLQTIMAAQAKNGQSSAQAAALAQLSPEQQAELMVAKLKQVLNN